MRSLEQVLLAGTLVLVGVVVWQGHLWFPGLTIQATSAVTLPAKLTAGKEAKAVHRTPAKNSALHSGASGTNESPEFSFPLPDLKSRTTVAKLPPGVPDAAKMEIGTTRSELRERYGVPTFAVSSVRDGSLVERYYYVKADHANLVIATLREGRLVGAQAAQVSQPRQNYIAPSAQ